MKTKLPLILLALSMSFYGCKDDDNDSNKGTSRVNVRMTDGPGNYEEVNVDIQGVQYHIEDGNQNSGWVSISTITGIYNLLDFTNGVDTLLASQDIPSGKISQVRLILGSNNTVKVDGQTYPLDVPSGSTSGLKVQVKETLVAGITYTFLLDFDVAKSIKQTGAGQYKLHPVIRLITTAVSGSIKGMIQPVAANPKILAIQGTDTAGAFADSAGNFLIQGLDGGSYNVLFDSDSGYVDTTYTNVSVVNGQVTNMGTIDLD